MIEVPDQRELFSCFPVIFSRPMIIFAQLDGAHDGEDSGESPREKYTGVYLLNLRELQFFHDGIVFFFDLEFDGIRDLWVL